MQQITSILIANRGEIASRIIRTCRKMGIRSIAVYSDADAQAPYVSEADVAVALGGNTPVETYLSMDKLIAAAAQTGAQAVHPGYGFLAENAEFATACAKASLTFIGPNPNAIATMGSKSESKALMAANGVPTVPGYQSEDQDVAIFKAEAAKIGYPVLLKAVAGGGGKGMRIVHEVQHFDAAFGAARNEAQNAFGQADVLLEKYFSQVRHVEFQVLGDHHGKVIHLLERECSIQRRYQKIIEEAPSPALSEDLRAKMGEAAVKAAELVGYHNAGTVEFILTDSGDFYFLEMNTRLQVEHPVTEMITGLDLVEWQIRIAEGEAIALLQEDIAANGYAVECRLYAEDPAQDYMPDTGTIHLLHWPETDDLRIESGIQTGSEVSVWYDPMLAKIITWGPNRASAHRKMQFALREMHCLGLKTNRAFLLALLQDTHVRVGDYDTHFLQRWKQPAVASPDAHNLALLAATLHAWARREQARTLLASLPSGWRNSFSEWQFAHFQANNSLHKVEYRFLNGAFRFKIGDAEYKAKVVASGDHFVDLEIDGVRQKFALARHAGQVWLQHAGNEFHFTVMDRFPHRETEGQENDYRAPMPAQVVRVLVKPGETVAAEAPLLVLSSMKMENTIRAAKAGTVKEVLVNEGDNIEAGIEMLVFEAEGEA